jgi:biotin transport system substrate-specific component
MTAIALARRISPSTAFLAGSLALSLLLGLSARVQVPFWPVPMTLQTFAVLAIAAFAGPRLAAGAVVAYLIEGAFGLPVFAGTPEHGIGLAYMVGPTGGYLISYLLAAMVVGAIVARAKDSVLAVAGAMLAGTLVIYALGAGWLAQFVGAERALLLGVVPFLLGDAVKAALAACLYLASRRIRRA